MRWAAERLLLLAVCALAPLACKTVELPLSPQFLVVDRTPESLDALSSDDARVRVRDFTAPGGDLAFWKDALRRNLVEGRGYALLEEGPVTARGVPGHAMTLEVTVAGRVVRYRVALFVRAVKKDESTVRVVEYVADKTGFDAHLEDVNSAISRMQPF